MNYFYENYQLAAPSSAHNRLFSFLILSYFIPFQSNGNE